MIIIAEGRINEGLAIVEEIYQSWVESGSKLRQSACGSVLAAVYAVLARKVEGSQQSKFAAAAAAKAHTYFRDSIQSARQIGANSTMGRAYLNWGYLHQQEGNVDRAAGCFNAAIQYFGLCNSDTYLVQAKKALAILDQRAEDRQEFGSRNAAGGESFDPELPAEGLNRVEVGMIA